MAQAGNRGRWIAVFFLPPEHRRTTRRGDGAKQVAGIGQEIHGFGQLRRVDFQVAAMDRGFGQLFRQLPRVDVVLRQLVGTVQDVAEAQLCVGCEHMGLQMNPYGINLRGRNAARRNLEARPGQQRHGDHHYFDPVVTLGTTRFGAGLDHVGQFVIGARTAVV